MVATCLGTYAGQDIIRQAPCPELRAQEAAGDGSKSEDTPKLPLWAQKAAERERQPKVVMSGLDLEMPTYEAEAPKVGAKTTEDNEAYWARKKHDLKVLYELRCVFRGVASTAEVERLFSVATRLSRPARSKMRHTTLQNLVTLTYEAKKEKREQQTGPLPAQQK